MKSRREKNRTEAISVEIDGVTHAVALLPSASVLEAVLEAGLTIPHSCGGMGTCGTCRVLVVSSPAELHDRNEVENEMASDRGFTSCERLACQLLPGAGLKVRIS